MKIKSKLYMVSFKGSHPVARSVFLALTCEFLWEEALRNVSEGCG